jgi:hypothetical protein
MISMWNINTRWVDCLSKILCGLLATINMQNENNENELFDFGSLPRKRRLSTEKNEFTSNGTLDGVACFICITVAISRID